MENTIEPGAFIPGPEKRKLSKMPVQSLILREASPEKLSPAPLQKWISIALVNLAIVAALGFLLRSKMIFSIPFFNFRYFLHAHSHFAFGGWVTVALLALMVYKMLPENLYSKPAYKWLLGGILFNSYGMLVSFPFEGYAFFSILFSTLFIFTSYGYACFFIRDILKTPASKSVKLLSVSANIFMVLSSAGAFSLAFLMMTKSHNVYLYKDAIYTYLHLQYSGFFTLGVFALLFHYLTKDNKQIFRFAAFLTTSVIPTLFISYLWHYPHWTVRSIAFCGCALLAASLFSFFPAVRSLRKSFKVLKPIARKIAFLSMASFLLKMAFQSLTIIPSLEPLVFSNRPVIIGFLHLVLLGFISLFLLAYFLQTGMLPYKKALPAALWIFTFGVILNEIILMAQGLGFMMMTGSKAAPYLLWFAAAFLFSGATMMACFRLWVAKGKQADRVLKTG